MGHLGILGASVSFFLPALVNPVFALGLSILIGIIAIANLAINCTSNSGALSSAILLTAMMGAAMLFAYYAILFVGFASLAAAVSSMSTAALGLEMFSYILSSIMVC